MRPAGIYLVEAQIGAARITNIPEGDILLTLRIGRNYASTNYTRTNISSPINFNTTVQVNVDSSALDTQRCSLTINLNSPNDKRMIGIALISLPKDKNQISNNYRLTQNEDKKAEVDIKIKITSIGNTSSVRNPTTLGLNSQPTAKFEQPKPQQDAVKQVQYNSTSNIKVKSKASEERSGQPSEVRKSVKNVKNEGQKMIEFSESEVKRFKQEKDVYYHMYQIQKSKNEVAAKFINSFTKKLAQKFPNLLPTPIEISQSGKRGGQSVSKKVDNNAAMAQLQQANRCLHRQIEEYKKIVEELKQQIFPRSGQEGQNAKKNNLIPPSILDLGIVPRQSSRQRSNMIPQSLKQPQHSVIMEAKASSTNDAHKTIKETFAGVDLKKWLELSIGQREEMKSKFVPPSIVQPQQERNESKTAFIKKLRSGIDKAFAQLLLNKDLSKAALLSHKQEVNRLLDENTF